MKKIFVPAVLVVLLLSMTVAYGQTVTDAERQLYYKVIDRVHALPEGSVQADFDRAAGEVAVENGLTYAEMDSIGNRVRDSDLSERELAIADDLYDRLAALPAGHTEGDTDRVYREVVRKYGISYAVLDDIDMRSWMWF